MALRTSYLPKRKMTAKKLKNAEKTKLSNKKIPPIPP